MCLATHLHGLERHHIQDRSVGGEEHVERRPNVFLLEFVGGEVGDVEGLVGRNGDDLCWETRREGAACGHCRVDSSELLRSCGVFR